MAVKLKPDRKKKEQERDAAKKALLKKIGVCALALLLVVGIGAAAWAIFAPKPVQILYDNEKGGYYDAKHDVLYHYAPVSYEPVKVRITEKYGVIDGETVYPLTGAESTRWLSEKYQGMGAVYYADGIELPVLTEFDADTVCICTESEMGVKQVRSIEVRNQVLAVIDKLENGEGAIMPTEATVYHLKFTSATYSWLYYDILYYEAEEGNYLYDRSRQKLVDAGTLLLGYLPRADMKADENTLIMPVEETKS